MDEDTRLPCTLCLAPPGSPPPDRRMPASMATRRPCEDADADADPRRSGIPAEPGTGLRERRACGVRLRVRLRCAAGSRAPAGPCPGVGVMYDDGAAGGR